MKKKVKKTKKAKKQEISVQDKIWGQYNPAPRMDVLMYVTDGMAEEEDPNEEKEFGLGEPQMQYAVKGDQRYIMNCGKIKTHSVKTVARKAPEFGANKDKNK